MNFFLSTYDYVALFFLLVSWIGYTWLVKRKSLSTVCLSSILSLYNRDWMLCLLARDNRITDSSVLSCLRASVGFFASTSMLIIAGLITGIASSEQAVGVLSTFPFVESITRESWEFKMVVLLVIFIYTFFEFTWSLRLYNFSCVLIGSAPLPHTIYDNEKAQNSFAEASSHIMTLAAMRFNYGLRGFYFALTAFTWFIHPLLFIICVSIVVGILYKREFQSSVLNELIRCREGIIDSMPKKEKKET